MSHNGSVHNISQDQISDEVVRLSGSHPMEDLGNIMIEARGALFGGDLTITS